MRLKNEAEKGRSLNLARWRAIMSDVPFSGPSARFLFQPADFGRRSGDSTCDLGGAKFNDVVLEVVR
jgi:hypothetical protein